MASKQQTTALFLSTIVTRTRRHTELTKKLTKLMGNLSRAREHSVRFFMHFFYSVKLHSLTYSVWSPLGCMGPFNQTTRLSSVALYGVAVGTTWSLLGVVYNGQAAFYLAYRLYSMGDSIMTVLRLSTAFPHLVAMQQSHAFRRLFGVITDYCFTTDHTCLSMLYLRDIFVNCNWVDTL